MRYFKVRNTATVPCTMPWVKTLLLEDDRKRYEAFKESPDYVGYDSEDASMKKKLPEAVKVRSFYDQLGKDVRIKVFDATKDGRQARYEWRFVIGPDIAKLKKENDLTEARRICEKYEIAVSPDETVADLAKKLEDKFGPNERILTEEQWLESGLQNLERREIKMKLQPGEETQRIVYEGYLEAEEMTEVEVKEWKDKQSGKSSAKSKKS